MAAKSQANFRFAEAVQEMLDLLAERDGTTRTAAVERLIRTEFRKRRYSLPKKEKKE